MTSIRKFLRHVGSPDAISWPVFWITLIAGVIGNAASAGRGVGIGIVLLVVILGQLVLWIPPLVLRGWMVLRESALNPIAVLGSFALGLLLRVYAMAWFSTLLAGAGEARIGYRLLGAVLNVGWVLLVAAYVVSSMRERRRQITSLTAVQSTLEESVETAGSELAQRNHDAVTRVREVLLRELVKLDGRDAAESLAQLQRTASEVVRPLSHELATAFPVQDERLPEVSNTRVTWLEVLDHAATERPFRPLLTGVLLAFPMLAALSLHPPLAPRLLFWLLSTIILIGGANRVLGWLMPGRARGLRIGFFLGGGVLVGALTTGIGLLLLSGEPNLAVIHVGIGVYAALFALSIAVISAFARDRERVIHQLEESSRLLQRSVVRMHQVQWLQQKALSRALHGPVQMAVNAAAIRLEDSIRHGVVSDADVNRAHAEVLDSLDLLDGSDTVVVTFTRAIERISAVWDGICVINVEATEDAASKLSDDSASRSCVIDIVTEAISNSVRHGHATRIDIEIRIPQPELPVLEVLVMGNGAQAPVGGSPGLGSQLLDECTLNWTLTLEDSGQQLRAQLPIS